MARNLSLGKSFPKVGIASSSRMPSEVSSYQININQTFFELSTLFNRAVEPIPRPGSSSSECSDNGSSSSECEDPPHQYFQFVFESSQKIC